MFTRKIYREMLDWREHYAGDYALFLRGMRGVGKTTLAEKLGREAFRSYILISLDRVGEAVKDLFVNGLTDLDGFFATLSVLYGRKLYAGESLIILDGVEHCPAARQAVKTLVEDGRYAVLETGCELPLKKENRPWLIPSEEYALNVLPMDFEEFLWAQGDKETTAFLRRQFENGLPMGAAHRTLMNRFKEYVLVGGMPEAVKAFLNGKDFEAADRAKRDILYRIGCYIDRSETHRRHYAAEFFRHIPCELAKRDKRYVFSHIRAGARLREYLKAIVQLEKMRVVKPIFNMEISGDTLLPITSDQSFKAYLADTGLLTTLAGGDRPFFENECYRALLLNRFEANEGMLMENAVAQCLTANGHRPSFLREMSKAKKKTVTDIDFVVRREGKIVPIAVETVKRGKVKFLRRINNVDSCRIGEPLLLWAGDMKVEDGIRYCPYYTAAIL